MCNSSKKKKKPKKREEKKKPTIFVKFVCACCRRSRYSHVPIPNWSLQFQIPIETNKQKISLSRHFVSSVWANRPGLSHSTLLWFQQKIHTCYFVCHSTAVWILTVSLPNILIFNPSNCAHRTPILSATTMTAINSNNDHMIYHIWELIVCTIQ